MSESKDKTRRKNQQRALSLERLESRWVYAGLSETLSPSIACEEIAPDAANAGTLPHASFDYEQLPTRQREFVPEPKTLYSSDTREAFWQDTPQGQQLDFNAQTQYLSIGNHVPTTEDSMVLTLSFSMRNRTGGLLFITGTDGVTSGRFDNEFAKGLVFAVEYSGISVWNYGSSGPQQVIGYTELRPHLVLGKTYDLRLENNGAEARVSLKDGPTVLADLRGRIPGTPEAGKVVVRKQNVDPSRALDVSRLTLTHGVTKPPAVSMEHRECQAAGQAAGQAAQGGQVAASSLSLSKNFLDPVTMVQQRLQTWEAKVGVRADEIAKLRAHMIGLEAEFAAARSWIERTREHLALRQQEAERIARNLSREIQKITPSVRVHGFTGWTTIRVEGHDLPADLRVRVGQDIYTLPQGTQEPSFPVPHTGSLQPIDVEILDAKGDVIARPLSVRAIKGKIKHDGGSGGATLTSLAYPDPAETVGGPFTSADLEEAHAAVKTVARELGTLEAAQLERHAALAAVTDKRVGLERAQIPYARMLVTVPQFQPHGQRVGFSIRFRTSTTRSTIEVHGPAGEQVALQRFTHPSGMADHTVSVGFTKPSRGGHIEALLRGEDGAVLDRVVMYYNDGTHALGIVTEQPLWETLETGRLLPHAIRPKLSVGRMEGPNVLLIVEAPGDQSYLSLDGGGLLSSQVLKHEGGTTFSPAILTLRADNPRGIYSTTLYERKNGRELDRLQFEWKAETRQLILLNEADRWTARTLQTTVGNHDESAGILPGDDLATRIAKDLSFEVAQLELQEAAQAEFAKLNLLTTIEIPTETNRHQSLRRMQKSVLYGRSRFFVSGSELERRFFNAYPHFHPTRFDDFVAAEWERTGRTYSRGSIRDTHARTRSELLTNYGRLLGSYEVVMADLVQATVAGFVGIRHGQSERPFVDAIRKQIDQARTLRHIREIAVIGIGIPNVDDLLAEGKRLFLENIDFLHERQADIERLHVQERNYQNKLANLTEAERQQQATDAAGLQLARRLLDLTPLVERWLVSESSEPASESASRDLARARRLVERTLTDRFDPRARLVIASGDSPVVQRVREIEDGFVDVLVRPEELRSAAAAINRSISEQPQNPHEVGVAVSRTLIAMTDVLTREVGIGNAIRVAELLPRDEVLLQLLSLWDARSGSAPTRMGEWHVRSDTLAGRIVLGTYQNAFSMTTKEAKALFAKVEMVTRVSSQRLWNLARNRDAERFSMGIVRLFREAGYHGAFKHESVAPALQPVLVSAATDSTVYRRGFIRVTWDIAPAGRQVSHVGLFLVDADDFNRQVLTRPLIEFVSNQLYADIPVEKLGKLDPERRFRIKVVAWLQDDRDAATDEGAIHDLTTPSFQIQWDGTRTSAVFPGYTVYTPHLLHEKTPGAFDFTLERDGSRRVPVLVPRNATVEQVRHEEESGGYGNMVVVRYDDDSAQLFAHFSEVTVVEGQRVQIGESLGLQGNTGFVKGPTGIHVHTEFGDWRDGRFVRDNNRDDARPLVDSYINGLRNGNFVDVLSFGNGNSGSPGLALRQVATLHEEATASLTRLVEAATVRLVVSPSRVGQASVLLQAIGRGSTLTVDGNFSSPIATDNSGQFYEGHQE